MITAPTPLPCHWQKTCASAFTATSHMTMPRGHSLLQPDHHLGGRATSAANDCLPTYPLNSAAPAPQEVEPRGRAETWDNRRFSGLVLQHVVQSDGLIAARANTDIGDTAPRKLLQATDIILRLLW